MEIVDTHIWTLFQSIREIKNPFKGNLGSHRRNNSRENGKKSQWLSIFFLQKDKWEPDWFVAVFFLAE